MQPNEPSSSDPQQPGGQPPQYGQPTEPQPSPYGQPTQQPAQYAPAPSGPSYGQPTAYARPAGAAAGGAMPGVVKWGLAIQWVGVALGAFALVIGLIGVLALAASGGDVAAVAGLVGLFVGVAALLLVLQVIVLIFATKGRNWARITLAVLAILGIVISLASGQGLNLGSAISVLSVVLLFLPDATAWYQARSRQR